MVNVALDTAMQNEEDNVNKNNSCIIKLNSLQSHYSIMTAKYKFYVAKNVCLQLQHLMFMEVALFPHKGKQNDI